MKYVGLTGSAIVFQSMLRVLSYRYFPVVRIMVRRFDAARIASLAGMDEEVVSRILRHNTTRWHEVRCSAGWTGARRERASGRRTLEGSVSAGWLAGKPDHPQKLKVPEGYEKINEIRNI